MPRYLEQANECTDPTTGDFLWVYDASAGATDKDRKVNISRFAILANQQSFTTTQTFAPSATNANGININMPVSTAAAALALYYNNALAFNFLAQPAARALQVSAFDNGSSVGTNVQIGHNSNASTPAAGHLLIYNRSATYYSIWPDASGNLRIVSGAQPTNATDTSGTVIGTQTSYAALKEDIAPWNGDGALDAVLACRLFGYRFKGDESQRQYHGIVINDDDRGAWFSENDADNQTPALNERNLFGYLIAAIKEQQVQIDELKEKLNRAN
jgi:hypothetical protein